MSDESEYEKECNAREAERAARLRKDERHRIALGVYRDLCLLERRRLDELKGGVELLVDYKAMARCATEAADALLAALETEPDSPVLPDYVA